MGKILVLISVFVGIPSLQQELNYLQIIILQTFKREREKIL